MRVKIFLSSGETVVHDVPDDAGQICLALPKDVCRFTYWRYITGDDRIKGHAMVWEEN